MNTITFQIENEKGIMQEWKNVSIPVKYGKFLDEQLDYATVELVRVKKKEFKLLSKSIITITDKEGKAEELCYFLANDNSFESPVGSGCYNHTLTLIELTKYLECFPLENLCFTNSKYKNFSVTAIPTVTSKETNSRFFYTPPIGDPVSRSFGLPNILDFFTPKDSLIEWYAVPDSLAPYYSYIEVTYGDGYKTFYFVDNTFNSDGTPTDSNGSITHKFEYDEAYGDVVSGDLGAFNAWNDGATEISNAIFDFETIYQKGDTVSFHVHISEIKHNSVGGAQSASNLDYEFSIKLEKNIYPTKPYTVKDVIDRVLDLVEPLREGESPRFALTVPQGKEAIFNQTAPEFTFTGMTLREALQTVGGFIHAEPRLTKDNKIVFDFYGEDELATYNSGKPLNEYKYKTYQGAHGIDQACNTLDSYIQNLVNKINEGESTTGSPYKGGKQTLRTETAYVRLEENDGSFFPTQCGINSISSFKIFYNRVWYDITKYLVEKTVYEWLSSYSNSANDSKNHALYFTLGEKGVKGFFYKRPNAISQSREKYTITNIINDVVGVGKKSYDYKNLQFSITYSPIYSTRVRESKQNVNEWLNLPRTINYAQSDNSVETSYFGEHLKGAVERLGTIEKTVVMNMRKLTNIPSAGMLWDNDYYISSVMVEVQNDIFEVSCALSKNFNRISKYIGVNSHKRVYEISERMVQQRHSIYTDYLMFTGTNTTYNNAGKNCYLTDLSKIVKISKKGETNDYTVSAVILQGKNKNDRVSNYKRVILPVIASAFGNSMQFTWEYKDNYSAGLKITEVSEQGISGYFSQEVEYCNYYGRLYWQDFSLAYAKEIGSASGIDTTALPLIQQFPNIDSTLASTNNPLKGSIPILKRKDSREALKETYNIELVTDNPNFVIGSAFASKNPIVYYDENRLAPKLYILPTRINKFATKIDLKGITAITGFAPWNTDSKLISALGATATANGKAWCYAIPEYDGKTYDVEDDDGNVTTITEKKGGELLFGENIDVEIGNTIGAFNAYVVHDVYDYLKTKEIDKTTKVIFINKDIYGNDTEIEITTGKDGIITSDMFPDVPDLKGQKFIDWVYYDKNENAQYLYGGEDVYSIAKNKVLTVYSLWEEITETPEFEFVIEDGIILGTNGELQGESLTIEDGTIISDYALSAGNMKAPDLRSVIINCPPIHTIGENIFSGQYIETIRIERIEGADFSIAKTAFDGLTNLTEVDIQGIDQMSFIEKINGDEFARGSKYTVYVHCSNGYLTFTNGKLQK